jgi:hypothetical protein
MNPDPPSQMHESLVENFFAFIQCRVVFLEDDFKRPKPVLFSPIFTKKEAKEVAKKTVKD